MENTKPIVRARRLSDGAVIPFYATPGSAGCDLVAAKTIIIYPGEAVIVPTGLAFEIPEGLEMQIRPRSGISLNTSLIVANSPGTVDSDYRGEVGVIVRNVEPPEYVLCHDGKYNIMTEECCLTNIKGEMVVTDEFYPVNSYIIQKGDRIAQAVFAPYIQVQFEEVDELSETQRGTGGFGHTGGNVNEKE